MPLDDVRTRIELPNHVAAELAGAHDSVMKSLEDRLGAGV